MGDEAPLDMSVAVDPYETHSYRIPLIVYNLHCKYQGIRVLSDVFCRDLSFTPR